MTGKMITVQVIKPYKDLEKMLMFHGGEQHAVSEKRAGELIQKGLVRKLNSEKQKEPEK